MTTTTETALINYLQAEIKTNSPFAQAFNAALNTGDSAEIVRLVHDWCDHVCAQYIAIRAAR